LNACVLPVHFAELRHWHQTRDIIWEPEFHN